MLQLSQLEISHTAIRMGRVSRSMPACLTATLLELTPRGDGGEIDARMKEQHESTAAVGHPEV